jgi:histidinol-phosphate phosphatase family protein
MRPAVFIDRDGVINKNPPFYVKAWKEFLFLSGVLPAFSRMSALPWPIIIVTNQSVVRRGIIEMEALNEIHTRMVLEIEQAGGRIDGLYVCPHHPDERCNCRKPEPGLLLRAAAELDLNLGQSAFLGDSRSDILAAINAGVQPVYRQDDGEVTYQAQNEWSPRSIQVPVVKDLMEFAEMLTLAASEEKHPADMIYYLAARITFSAIRNS